MTIAGAFNAEYVDRLYALWREGREQVGADWRAFFEGFELGASVPAEAPCAPDACLRQARFEALVSAYREHGHLLACLDPLVECPRAHPLLEPSAYGLTGEDLDAEVHAPDFSPDGRARLGSVLEVLRETYCGSVGVEYTHVQDPEERRWLRERLEGSRNRVALSVPESVRVLELLARAGRFEEFLHRTYLGQTRFSLEGADAAIAFSDALLSDAADRGVREVILGMAHRGRLNVEAHLLGCTYEEIFCEFESTYDPETQAGGGDVKYHKGFLADVEVEGKPLRLFLPENPSHLEAVNPVVEGIARARQDRSAERKRVLPFLIHGDAAFSGQGIVAETLNLSQLEGYRTQGTVHLVVNNQIGYTTLPEDARSTRYSTDLAKMLMIPVFHVHGEDPEAAVHVARLVSAYRARFAKDVVVDLVCFRRYGHNEGDEPYFTQPRMYDRIRERPPLYRLYGEELVRRGVLSAEEVEERGGAIDAELERSLATARERACSWPLVRHYEEWEGFLGKYSPEAPPTGVPEERLRALSRRLNAAPDGFSLHPKLARILQRRQEAAERGEGLDWGSAEALAFASLLAEGTPVRLSGEDSRRGTFSHRHAVWADVRTGRRWTPLAALSEDQATFWAYDSMLSEAGVLGFEYGYSLVAPRTLVLWEAQYGDFANGAQVIIDQFVASGQAKWQRPSGLVLLLPHGYEGQGPDHSTARPERFLQLCARENMEVCVPTTPAQYFHLLRRQMKRSFRRPLVLLTPKSLLRHPLAVSRLEELARGGFEPVLDDPIQAPEARRVVLSAGKVHYELRERRERLGEEGREIALLRLEQLYPFPAREFARLAEKYGRSRWVWAQEEPENMGGWQAVREPLASALGREPELVSRPAEPSPDTGFLTIFRQEQSALLDRALAPATAPEGSRRADPRRSESDPRPRQTGPELAKPAQRVSA